MTDDDTRWLDAAMDHAHDAGFTVKWGVETTAARPSLYSPPRTKTIHWVRLTDRNGKWIDERHTGTSRDKAAWALVQHNWPPQEDRPEP